MGPARTIIGGMADPDREAPGQRPGALVLSLDFELAWGVFDTLGQDGPYRRNLLGAREAIPRILDLFDAFEVSATWAIVGFLFAESREELEAYSPELRPSYRNPRLNPYRIAIGDGERDDPLHFAPSLVRTIAAAHRQEIGSHTFSHYYCLEAGQDVHAFEADLQAAVAIARARGVDLRSLVLPRHQFRADYLPAVDRTGFRTHRTNEANRWNRPNVTGGDTASTRSVRLLDSYLPVSGPNDVPWSSTVPDRHGLVDVRESRFLRPANARLRALEPLRVQRLIGAMRHAARTGRIFHLWWHPHNFGAHPEANLANLRTLLEAFARLRDDEGMTSMSMADVDAVARASAPSATRGSHRHGTTTAVASRGNTTA